MKECAADMICEPAIGVWCCDELIEQVCDGGETCECKVGEEVCGRSYMLVDGMIVRDGTDDEVLDQCPHCGAEIVTQSIQKGGDR